MSLKYLKKVDRGKVDFLHADKNEKVSYKLISTLWTLKFPTR